MKLLFKFPTRSRPRIFRRTLDRYYSFLSRQHPFQFLITMDTDDGSMNNDHMKGYLSSRENLMYCYGRSTCKVEAINEHIECADPDWDILVCLADDMLPNIAGFDDIIVQSMKEHFPDTDGAIWFNDGRVGPALATMAIMGRKVYERFGYIYHPEYRSLWCDNEYQAVLQQMDKLRFIDQNIIIHKWTDLTGKDHLHRRNENFYGPDKATFEKRKNGGFPKTAVEVKSE